MTERKKRADRERKTTTRSYGPEFHDPTRDKRASRDVVHNRDGRISERVPAGPRRAAPAAVVSRAEHDALRRALERLADRVEDLEDALEAQAARATAKPEDALPAALVDRLIAGESPVRIWREHRGLTLTALAERAEIPAGYLSEIENRKKPGSLRAMRALARALDLDLDDLVRDPAELAPDEST